MIYEAKLTCADLSPSTIWLSEDSVGSSSALKLVRYIPVSAGKDDAKVAESMEVLGNISDIRTAVQNIERYFSLARSEPQKMVYLDVRINETDWYRTRVFDGLAQFVSNAAFWHNPDFAKIAISFERAFGWEGPEAELALTNSSGSGTGGRAVGNENYSTTENWVTIAGAAVQGDLPARARLEITHTYAVNPFIKEIWLYHKIDAPTAFVHFLQGESATGGSNSADANASGGSKKAVSWAVTSKTKLLSWTLTAASLNAMAGGQAHALLRHDGAAYTDLYLQFQLRTTGATLISEGALAPVANDIEMLVLDTLRLPPGGIVSGSSDLTLELYGQRLSAGTHNLAIDFVQLSPVGPGNSWQKLTCIGSGLALNEKLVLDDINKRVYRVVSGVNIADWALDGSGIQLQPGRDQRIYILGAENGNNYRRLQTYTVRMYYRPRRRSL